MNTTVVGGSIVWLCVCNKNLDFLPIQSVVEGKSPEIACELCSNNFELCKMVKTGSSMHTTPGRSVKKVENRLTRETPFVSNIKFRANLPEVILEFDLSVFF